MSEFIRAVLLDKPLVTTYRNASQDSLLEAMALLTKELNAIGNNVNQSVKRLHTLREHESASWTAKYAAESMRLEIKVNEAKALLNAIAERWLR
jgi:hypothetical protein